MKDGLSFLSFLQFLQFLFKNTGIHIHKERKRTKTLVLMYSLELSTCKLQPSSILSGATTLNFSLGVCRHRLPLHSSFFFFFSFGFFHSCIIDILMYLFRTTPANVACINCRSSLVCMPWQSMLGCVPSYVIVYYCCC